jgi:hypothetical protein
VDGPVSPVELPSSPQAAKSIVESAAIVDRLHRLGRRVRRNMALHVTRVGTASRNGVEMPTSAGAGVE